MVMAIVLAVTVVLACDAVAVDNEDLAVAEIVIAVQACRKHIGPMDPNYILTHQIVITRSKPTMDGARALAKANGQMRKLEKRSPPRNRRKVDGMPMLKIPPGTRTPSRPRFRRKVPSPMLPLLRPRQNQKIPANRMPTTLLSKLPRSWRDLV